MANMHATTSGQQLRIVHTLTNTSGAGELTSQFIWPCDKESTRHPCIKQKSKSPGGYMLPGKNFCVYLVGQ